MHGENCPPCRGKVKNISGSGILIEAPARFEPHTLLQIEIAAAESDPNQKPVIARIRVLRIDGEKPPYNLAAEFLKLNLP